MNHNCAFCHCIKNIKSQQDRNFVCETELGYIVMGNYQFYRGYVLYVLKQHVCSLADLESELRARFLLEMDEIGKSIMSAFQPHRINYELQGNSCPHLHWHLFPRYPDDPVPHLQIACTPREIRETSDSILDDVDLSALKLELLEELQQKKLNVIRDFTQ